ncbi:MAG: hypothetical protein DWB44_08960 [Chloroflexi bacterium]|nr:hypothetical protein [Chloroflexota bacterium]OQY85246.1 MAG: hypothetical protein B6D42_03725 [Anaerolineae bacterium UTCFX5]RIK20804.1 MAG: hypothetical protein DCC53_09290 [Chloroflexota bacterium]
MLGRNAESAGRAAAVGLVTPSRNSGPSSAISVGGWMSMVGLGARSGNADVGVAVGSGPNATSQPAAASIKIMMRGTYRFMGGSIG